MSSKTFAFRLPSAPYWETEGYGVEFPLSEYEQLAELATSIDGTMVISINDHPEMRRVFADLPFVEVAIDYTVGLENIEASELIFGNWDGGVPHHVGQVGLF